MAYIATKIYGFHASFAIGFNASFTILTWLQVLNLRANGLHNPHELTTHNITRLHTWHKPYIHVKVWTTDACGCNAQDGICLHKNSCKQPSTSKVGEIKVRHWSRILHCNYSFWSPKETFVKLCTSKRNIGPSSASSELSMCVKPGPRWHPEVQWSVYFLAWKAVRKKKAHETQTCLGPLEFPAYRICDQGPRSLANLHVSLAVVLHGSHFVLLILFGSDCASRGLQDWRILQHCVSRRYRNSLWGLHLSSHFLSAICSPWTRRQPTWVSRRRRSRRSWRGKTDLDEGIISKQVCKDNGVGLTIQNRRNARKFHCDA